MSVDLSRKEALRLSAALKARLASTVEAWTPRTDEERRRCELFRELLHAAHGVRREGWPHLEFEDAAALDAFGGRKALLLIDADHVMLARETFCKLYGSRQKVAADD